MIIIFIQIGETFQALTIFNEYTIDLSTFNDNAFQVLRQRVSNNVQIPFDKEIAIEVTGVVGVSPALWYFRYIASIFLTLHKRLCFKFTS
jgi:hypothetical protein